MNDTTKHPISGEYVTVFAAYTNPAPAGGGPRQVRADVVAVSYVIDGGGVHETGHRILHSALMMLASDGGDAYLSGGTGD